MTSGKKVGGPKTKTKFQNIFFNLDKVLGGAGKRIQCHKNSYLKNLVFYCLETALFGQKISILNFQSKETINGVHKRVPL